MKVRIAAAALIVAALAGCNHSHPHPGPTPAPTHSVTSPTTPPVTRPATTPATTPATSPAPTTSAPVISLEQRNATQAAKDYLDTQGFSRTALIKQLTSSYADGYSKKAATAAVDSLHINYNEQAARSAKEYLDTQSFSRAGLIQQLSSSFGGGYTRAQATYGVKAAGL